MTCLILFPSRLQKRMIEFDNNSCYESEFTEPGLPLIISFAGLGDKFEFKKILSGYPVNVIYVRDLLHQWYLNRLIGIGNGVVENKDFLEEKIRKMRPSRVITLGTSAGGFGAILYGTLMEVDRIVVFSPQTFRNKWLCFWKWDYRWLDRVVDIYRASEENRKFLDLKTLAKHFNGTLVLYYDRTNRLDNLHGERLKGKKIIHSTYDFGGHNLVQILKQRGLLFDLIEHNLGLNNA